MEKFNVQPGTKVAPDRFHITVMEEGPYLVYGQPPLKQQFMLPNRRRNLVLQGGQRVCYPRRTDGAVPLRRVEDQAVLRRFARAYRLGPVAYRIGRTAAG